MKIILVLRFLETLTSDDDEVSMQVFQVRMLEG